jgi:hypothetical protein
MNMGNRQRQDGFSERSARITRTRRAFTAIELIMGLAITAMVMTAMGGVMAAVAQGWRATEITQNGTVGETAAGARISRTLREALAVGTPATSPDGSSGLMFWEEDVDSNGAEKISEMAALEFNAGTNQVRVLSIQTTRYDIWSGLFGDLLDGALIVQVKSLLGLLSGGQPEVTSRVLADNVKSAKFVRIAKGASSDFDRVEYTLVFERAVPGSTTRKAISTVYGCATLRSPAG